MSISNKLKSYLDKEKVNYEELHHPEAYTAAVIAGMQHVPGRQFAKCVIVQADGDIIICVLPAIYILDNEKLKVVTRAEYIRLLREDEIGRLFPDFAVGAEPPFGNLYGLPVYADEALSENEDIVFNAGTHTDSVKIKWNDFVRLASPKICDIGKHI